MFSMTESECVHGSGRQVKSLSSVVLLLECDEAEGVEFEWVWVDFFIQMDAVYCDNDGRSSRNRRAVGEGVLVNHNSRRRDWKGIKFLSISKKTTWAYAFQWGATFAPLLWSCPFCTSDRCLPLSSPPVEWCLRLLLGEASCILDKWPNNKMHVWKPSSN